MSTDQVSSSDGAHAPVGSQDNDGGQTLFQGSIEVGKTLDVEHMDLVDEEHSGHQFSHSLVDVLVHHLVDLLSQLLCYFSLLRFHHLAHHTHEVLSSLWLRIRLVQVMQSHILHYFLLLMNISFG